MAMRWNWQISHVEPAVIADSRHAFARALRERGFADMQIESAVMIFGELIANACEHGRVPVDIELSTRGTSVVLRVVDSGQDLKRPSKRDPLSLRGRGFEIIERLGGTIALTPRPRSTVRVVLPFGAAV